MTHLAILEKILPALEDLIFSVRYILTDHAETPLVDEDFINTNKKVLELHDLAEDYLNSINYGVKNKKQDLAPDLEKLFPGAEDLAEILESTIGVITREQNRAKIFSIIIKIVSDGAPVEQTMQEILDQSNGFTDYAMKLLDRRI